MRERERERDRCGLSFCKTTYKPKMKSVFTSLFELAYIASPTRNTLTRTSYVLYRLLGHPVLRRDFLWACRLFFFSPSPRFPSATKYGIL